MWRWLRAFCPPPCAFGVHENFGRSLGGSGRRWAVKHRDNIRGPILEKTTAIDFADSVVIHENDRDIAEISSAGFRETARRQEGEAFQAIERYGEFLLLVEYSDLHGLDMRYGYAACWPA